MVESRSLPPERVAAFLEYACPDARVIGPGARRSAQNAAMRILTRHPDIARDSLYTAVVCGDLEEVQRILSVRPDAASENGGPKGWPPLLYLCNARLPLATARDNPSTLREPQGRPEQGRGTTSSGAPVAIARALLDRGADPNSYYVLRGVEDYHYTALTCVLGRGEEVATLHPDAEALARLLLERGAEPYDTQLLYNVFADNTSRPLLADDIIWLLELIYTHSVQRGRQADWNDPTWSMLDMGGGRPAARYLLEAAVEGNHLELAQWFLTHGASPNALSWPGSRLTHTLHEEALRRGFTEMADLLLRFGATPGVVRLDDRETFEAACVRVDRHAAQAMLERHSEYLHDPGPMMTAARLDRLDVAALLLDLGMSPDVSDTGGARALHMAAGANALRVTRLLVERGAEIDFRDPAYDATPFGWAVHYDQPRTIEYLRRISRDVFNLAGTGHVERLRQVLSAEPERAKEMHWGVTPLFCLPDDEQRAMEVVELFLACGTDTAIRNRAGLTAEEQARKEGFDEVAARLQF